jgi:hypothetical protein
MLTLLKGICRRVEMAPEMKSSAHSRFSQKPLVTVNMRERYSEYKK